MRQLCTILDGQTVIQALKALFKVRHKSTKEHDACNIEQIGQVYADYV